MDVTPLIPAGRQVIQSYSEAGFKVSGTLFRGAVFVTPEQSWDWNFTGSADTLTEKDFEPLLKFAEDLDIVLLGTGFRHVFVSPAMRRDLKERGLALDPMDSGAACRTYNVLMAEGRRVAAALLPLPVQSKDR